MKTTVIDYLQRSTGRYVSLLVIFRKFKFRDSVPYIAI